MAAELYRPGAGPPRPKKLSRRECGRRGGLASGRMRRKLAKGRKVPHSRDRPLAIAKAYKVRQASRAAFARRYVKCCAQIWRIRVSARGLETAWQLYLADFGGYRHKGQDHQTTNGQRAAALSARGRARCPRTVQRTRARLEAMGLVRYAHVRRHGARVGARDSLRVCILSFVTPPSAARSNPFRVASSGSTTSDSAGCAGRTRPPAAPALVAPPDGGRDPAPAAPAPLDDKFLAMLAAHNVPPSLLDGLQPRGREP